MAADDYAVVVGITKYPEIGDLQGPENDAQAFYDWLRSPQGGNVKESHITLIVSSKYDNSAAGALLTQPLRDQVEAAFVELINQAGDSGTLGRRLYIFLAGHGIGVDIEEVALLMANAGVRSKYHLPGRSVATLLRTSALFKEIVLFMDCCRDDYPYIPKYLPLWELESRPAAADVRYFYGFATKWSRKAREKEVTPGGPVRGLFTRALLAALEKAPPDEQGRVTGTIVAGYVFNELKRLVAENEYQEPRFEYEPQRDIILVEPRPINALDAVSSPATIPVHLQPAPAIVGQRVEILNHRFEPVAETEAVADNWTVNLEAGIYQARVPGTAHEKVFDVIGEEAINVNLD
ncbi:MAG: caspase family protein [Anaerolineae bacterium]|nr:caspase family protein [Anaerolineae bacterium]